MESKALLLLLLVVAAAAAVSLAGPGPVKTQNGQPEDFCYKNSECPNDHCCNNRCSDTPCVSAG